jgi:hypothetical protein
LPSVCVTSGPKIALMVLLSTSPPGSGPIRIVRFFGSGRFAGIGGVSGSSIFANARGEEENDRHGGLASGDLCDCIMETKEGLEVECCRQKRRANASVTVFH